MTYVCSLEGSAADMLSGSTIVKTQSELYRVIGLKSCKELTLKSDFVLKHFTASGLKSFLGNLKEINPTCRVNVDPALVGDNHKDVNLLIAMRSPEDLINYLLNNREDGFQFIQTLAREYNKSYEEALSANNKLSTLHLEVSQRTQEALSEKLRRERLTQELADTRSNFETLVSRIKFTYGRELDPDKIDRLDIDICQYTSILYIKEHTRVRYVDTLIYYLQQLAQIVSGRPTRLLVVESPYAYARRELYPDCVPHLNLTVNHVYKSDIFMAGFQSNIVKDILRNPSGVESLIVLDRSGSDEPHICGKGVHTYYTVSDLKDLGMCVTPENTLSYSKKTLHVPHVQGFDNLAPEEKISKYSSFEVTKKLLHVLRGNVDE